LKGKGKSITWGSVSVVFMILTRGLLLAGVAVSWDSFTGRWLLIVCIHASTCGCTISFSRAVSFHPIVEIRGAVTWRVGEALCSYFQDESVSRSAKQAMRFFPCRCKEAIVCLSHKRASVDSYLADFGKNIKMLRILCDLCLLNSELLNIVVASELELKGTVVSRHYCTWIFKECWIIFHDQTDFFYVKEIYDQHNFVQLFNCDC